MLYYHPVCKVLLISIGNASYVLASQAPLSRSYVIEHQKDVKLEKLIVLLLKESVDASLLSSEMKFDMLCQKL